MFYFSTIYNSRVKDNNNELDGKVTDILIAAEESEVAKIIGLVVKGKKNDTNFIPVENVKNWESKYIELNGKIDKIIQPLPAKGAYISLYWSVIDKQIVDLMGLRIVRVNDLQFGLIQQTMCLIAIDISTRGLLRRLGLYHPVFDLIFKSHFLPWQTVRLVADKIHLSAGSKELVKFHPADIANVIEKMNIKQATTWLQSLDQGTAARVLEEIQPDIKKIFIKSLGPERAAALLTKMSVDELADLLQLMPQSEAKAIIDKLPRDTKTQNVERILRYDEDTAGGLMTTEYLSAQPNATIQEVIEQISKVSAAYHSIQYVYIIDTTGKFVGVISLRNLILADRNLKVSEVIKKKKQLLTASANQGISSLAKLMTKYNLLSVAVLDKDRKLLGVVTVDDIMRRLVPDA